MNKRACGKAHKWGRQTAFRDTPKLNTLARRDSAQEQTTIRPVILCVHPPGRRVSQLIHLPRPQTRMPARVRTGKSACREKGDGSR